MSADDDDVRATARFQHDTVTRFSPITFSLAFVSAMRKRKELSHVPSVRTAVALPRFLTARYFRTRSLNARDYVEAAVLLTPLEDQGVAFEVARELLFPKEKGPELKTEEASVLDVEGVRVVSDPAAAQPQGPSVLDTLAGMNLANLDTLDLAALDASLEAKTEMKSLDLLTELSTSDDPKQQSLATLVGELGGVAELEADGAHDEPTVRKLLMERLLGGLGDLSAPAVAAAGHAGFTDALLDDVVAPWEKAGLLASTPGKEKDLDALLDALLKKGSARELGQSLKFVKAAGKRKTITGFQKRALASARHLSDWAEILQGLGEFIEPPKELVKSSATDNIRGALQAAALMHQAFGGPAPSLSDWEDDSLEVDDAPEEKPDKLQKNVFDAWADAVIGTPDLDFLADVCVPGKRWDELVGDAFELLEEDLGAKRNDLEAIGTALKAARRMKDTHTSAGRAVAGKVATLAMTLIDERKRFLPLLDAIVDIGLMPHDAKAVVAAGAKLLIDEEDVYARLSQPLEQLRFLIEGNVQDLERHLELVDQVDHVPDELLTHLLECVMRDQNRMGLALLLAVALGPVLQKVGAGVSPELVDQSLGYQGIGGGENLLLQWFTHRDELPNEFKDRVRALAKHALLDVALTWAQKGSGGAERGLLPQSRTRPYRTGDDVEHLDVDGTLETLTLSGKSLDQLTTEEMVVSDTSSGRAGFGVLIDISGSMSGNDLAVCAIAVVMLLGRLKPEELALALFESNTHVVKRFADATDLDHVADDLLELRATGGTRVDAALDFIRDEFAGQSEQERRVLFLLSDFAFFETRAELDPLLHQLRELDVHFLGAAHGHISKDVAAHFAEVLEGQVTRIPSLQKLPEVLLQALTWISSAPMGR